VAFPPLEEQDMKSSTTFVVLSMLVGAGCATTPGEPAEDGPLVFEDYCAPCHGDQAHGDVDIGAPAIAGLPAWYTLEQLHKYRDGRRGAHKDDAEGLRMRPMSRTLESDAYVDLVAEYIASLPPVRPAATLAAGDPANGATLYGTCAACHGPDGAGNEQLHAPPLTIQQDWYVARQLGKFKAGVRGVDPKDVYGNQMRPMAALLTDDQAVTDVVTHIQTLGR
jgi:cytochrome c553